MPCRTSEFTENWADDVEEVDENAEREKSRTGRDGHGKARETSGGGDDDERAGGAMKAYPGATNERSQETNRMRERQGVSHIMPMRAGSWGHKQPPRPPGRLRAFGTAFACVAVTYSPWLACSFVCSNSFPTRALACEVCSLGTRRTAARPRRLRNWRARRP